MKPFVWGDTTIEFGEITGEVLSITKQQGLTAATKEERFYPKMTHAGGVQPASTPSAAPICMQMIKLKKADGKEIELTVSSAEIGLQNGHHITAAYAKNRYHESMITTIFNKNTGRLTPIVTATTLNDMFTINNPVFWKTWWFNALGVISVMIASFMIGSDVICYGLYGVALFFAYMIYNSFSYTPRMEKRLTVYLENLGKELACSIN